MNLAFCSKRIGVRTRITCYTEIVFASKSSVKDDRPDGLIVVTSGGKEWRALVEAKVGTATLTADQIERYRRLAHDHGIDCVITISNQFAAQPQNHPIEEVRRSRAKIPVFHWSWMHILTVTDLLLTGEDVEDPDQASILSELRRFLTHESAGVRGFDRMPPEWSELNKLISSGGSVPAKSTLARDVLGAWHQETRDLSLILSRMTGARVTEKLPRRHLQDPGARLTDELARLRESRQLGCQLAVPDAAAPIEVVADIPRRSIDIGMTLRAPEERKSTRARVNWLLRQIKSEDVEDMYIRLIWPGTSEATQYPVADLREDVSQAELDKTHLKPTSFHVFLSKRIGVRFAQQVNFISDLEDLVPRFYGTVGSGLRSHQRPAPALKPDRTQPEDVTPEAISEADSPEPSARRDDQL